MKNTIQYIGQTAPSEKLSECDGTRRFAPISKAKKIKTPKMLIKATGPFMQVEIPVFRGNGTSELRRIKRIHDTSLDKEFPKPKPVARKRYGYRDIAYRRSYANGTTTEVAPIMG